MPRLTIQEQGMLIPRPSYRAVETSPGVIEFHVAQKAVKAVTEPVQQPQEPVHTEPETPTYQPQTIGQKIVQWVEDAPIRRQDYWSETDLYAELKAKRRREQLFLRAASLGLLDTGHDSYKRQLGRLAKRQGV